MEDQNSDTPQNFKKNGDSYLKRGEYQKAIQYYKKAIELDPHYIKAWHNLGHSFIKLGQKNDAIRCSQKIKELKAFHEDPSFQDPMSGEKIHIPFPRDEKKQAQDNTVTDKLSQTPKHDEQPGSIQFEIQEKPTNFEKELVLTGTYDGVNGEGTVDHEVSVIASKYKQDNSEGGISSLCPSSQVTTNSIFLKKAIYISIIIGMCLMAYLLILGSHSERYSQFYLYPDSIQTINNTSSFIYGVESFEHNATQYQLAIYDGSELVDMDAFTLDPGETRKERKSFEYKGLTSEYPKKIDIILKSPYQTYNLHYWIKK